VNLVRGLLQDKLGIFAFTAAAAAVTRRWSKLENANQLLRGAAAAVAVLLMPIAACFFVFLNLN